MAALYKVLCYNKAIVIKTLCFWHKDLDQWNRTDTRNSPTHFEGYWICSLSHSGDGSMTVDTCQNSLNCTFEISDTYFMSVIPQWSFLFNIPILFFNDITILWQIINIYWLITLLILLFLFMDFIPPPFFPPPLLPCYQWHQCEQLQGINHGWFKPIAVILFISLCFPSFPCSLGRPCDPHLANKV